MDTLRAADTTDQDCRQLLATASKEFAAAADASDPALETLKVSKEGAVLFADIAAPPMNLLGPALVRDLVSLIQRAEADNDLKVVVFRSADPTISSPTWM